MTDNGRNYTAHRNQRYGMREMSAAAKLLESTGWTFEVDYYSPYSDLRGWYVNPNHATKSKRTGDSKPKMTAAIDTVALYTEITPDEIYQAA